jgi:hypothetical protein
MIARQDADLIQRRQQLAGEVDHGMPRLMARYDATLFQVFHHRATAQLQPKFKSSLLTSACLSEKVK